MAKASPALVSFNAGELSPRLDGRVDLEKYGKGCRTLQNFLPLVQGGAMKRSGFRYVRTTGHARLIPFQFNTSDAYVVSIGTAGIVFHKNGNAVFSGSYAITGATQANPVVITAVGHGFVTGDTANINGVGGMTQINGRWHVVGATTANTFELSGVDGTGYGAYTSGGTASRLYALTPSPYTSEDEINSLQFAGQNDVLYIACPTKAPRKLSRFGDASWTIEEVEFEHFPFSPENIDEANFMCASFTGATAPSDGWSVISSAGEFSPNMVGGYIKLREIAEAYNPEWTADVDLDLEKFRAFQANSASFEIGDRIQNEGRVYELARRGTNGFTGTVPPAHDSGFASDGLADWQFVNYGYGYGKVVRYVDAFRVDVDELVEFPRSTISPQRSTTSMSSANPIVVTMSAAHGWETGDQVFFRGTGGTFGPVLDNTLRTITRLSSTTFSIPVNGTGLVGGGGAFVYRMSAARNATGTNGQIFPSMFRWSFGAWDDVRGYPRAVTFFEDRLIWGGTNSNPQTCWASRTGRYEDHAEFQESDSALVFTLSSSEPVQWLAEQNALVIGTSGDEFSSDRDAAEPLSPENVNTIRRRSRYGSRTSVPPVLADNVLLFVQRAGRKLRELIFTEDVGGLSATDMTRLADHITLGIIKQCAFQTEPDRLLWAVLEDETLVCLTYERDEQVFAWHRHVIGGTSPKVISVAVIPHPDGDADQLWALVERTLADGTVRTIEYMEKAWTRIDALADAVFVDSARIYDGAPTTTVSGLWLLRNQSVEVLADGVSVGPLTVSSLGVLTLPSAASKVQVGLGYDAVLIPMRIEAGSAEGTAQGKLKRIASLKLRVDQTGRGLFIGPSQALATEEVTLPDGQLTDGDTSLLPWPGGWESDGIIAIKHSKPTPCTITAILPRLTTNDG